MCFRRQVRLRRAGPRGEVQRNAAMLIWIRDAGGPASWVDAEVVLQAFEQVVYHLKQHRERVSDQNTLTYTEQCLQHSVLMEPH